MKKKKITNSYILEDLCKLNRNGKNIKALNNVKKMINSDKVIEDNVFVFMKRQKEIYDVLVSNGLVSYKFNNNVYHDYYNNYCNLIVGTDEAVEIIEALDFRDNKITVITPKAVKQYFNNNIHRVKYINIYKKAQTVNEKFVKVPNKIYETWKEIEDQKERLKEFKRYKEEMKQLAFEEASYNFNAEFNQLFYDELSNCLLRNNCALYVA